MHCHLPRAQSREPRAKNAKAESRQLEMALAKAFTKTESFDRFLEVSPDALGSLYPLPTTGPISPHSRGHT